MLQELVIVSVYDDLLKKIQDVCQHMKIDPVIIEWEQATKELVSHLSSIFEETRYPDVIISRGAVANLIETHFKSIVVIRAEPDDIDLLESLYQAKTRGTRIGLLIYEPYSLAFKTDSIVKILGLKELRIYPFRSKEDIENGIVRAKQDGLNAVIGGGNLGQRTGKQLLFPVFFAETSKRSLRNSIMQALAIINARKREKKQLQYFRTAVASVQEGIMTLRDGKITLVNTEFSKILQVKSEHLLDQNLNQLRFVLGDEVCRFITQSIKDEEILNIKNNTCLIKKVDVSNGDSSEEVMVIVQDVSNIQQQEQKIRRKLNSKGFKANYHFKDIIGSSDKIKEVIEKAITFAQTDANILINGESGTGKELFAQSIHNASDRGRQPFVAINCAAIPESLLESELFGYEEGAFSGAKKGGNPGLFELAHGGTIFLDEINSLPITLQGVLLRAIQEKEIRRVGSQNILSVDVRIISASNVDIETLITAGLFRTDLYYRLNTLKLILPPLSLRKEDVLLLAEHFLDSYSTKYAIPVIRFSDDDCQTLLSKEWKGNVRELENVVHRYTVLSKNMSLPFSISACMDNMTQPEWPLKKQIELLHMRQPENSGNTDADQPKEEKSKPDFLYIHKGTLVEIEQQVIRSFLEECRWNQREAATKLGICRSTLWKKLKNMPEF